MAIGSMSNAVLTSGAQTVAGVKTFSSDPVLPGGDCMLIGPFYQDNVTASQSAVALNMTCSSATAITGIPAIRAGSIIGISVTSNEARSAGVLTVDATIAGSVTGLQAVLDDNPTTQAVTTQAKDADTFTAGQLLGIKITTDGDWAPTTADITCWLLVEM